MTTTTQAVARKDPPATAELMRAVGTVQEMDKFIQAMGNQVFPLLERTIEPRHFLRVALNAWHRVPQLRACTRQSLLVALMDCAELGLEPNSPLRHAYLIPYRDNKRNVTECQLQLSYPGYLELIRRDGTIKKVYTEVVYPGDEFRVTKGTDKQIIHVPRYNDGAEELQGIYFYCVSYFDNAALNDFEVLPREKCLAVGRRSKTFDRKAGDWYPGTPWKEHPDEMCRKTVLKLHAKSLPLGGTFRRAEEIDNREFNRGRRQDGEVVDVRSGSGAPSLEEELGRAGVHDQGEGENGQERAGTGEAPAASKPAERVPPGRSRSKTGRDSGSPEADSSSEQRRRRRQRFDVVVEHNGRRFRFEAVLAHSHGQAQREAQIATEGFVDAGIEPDPTWKMEELEPELNGDAVESPESDAEGDATGTPQAEENAQETANDVGRRRRELMKAIEEVQGELASRPQGADPLPEMVDMGLVDLQDLHARLCAELAGEE